MGETQLKAELGVEPYVHHGLSSVGTHFGEGEFGNDGLPELGPPPCSTIKTLSSVMVETPCEAELGVESSMLDDDRSSTFPPSMLIIELLFGRGSSALLGFFMNNAL
ncbi:hypothetical protein Dimus_015451 [Dionaea muscipula]